MHKKITFGILLVSIVVVAVSMLTPVPVDQEAHLQDRPITQFLPWQIEPTAQGSIRVFGLTLGESTLQDAENLFHGGAEVSLFVSSDERYKVEAYFDKVILGGFSAQLVMVMALSQEQQATMFQRGVRMSNLGAGRKKVTLAGEDLKTVFAAPVASIAYLTRTRLDDELLRKRFGEPAQRIREGENNTTHWLYPELGLDIALHDEGRAVLQYVSPKEFSGLVAPLQEQELQLK
jgi:hypothetical protein